MAAFSVHSSYRAALEDMRSNCISGPYPEFIKKFYSIKNDDLDRFIQSELGARGVCPRQTDACEWLTTLLGVRVPEQRWEWVPYGVPTETLWMSGQNFLLLLYGNKDHDSQNISAIYHAADKTETYQGALAHLYTMAKGVFRSQNVRFFIRGVLLRESTVEFWVFDRSGMYCSEPFDPVTNSVQIVALVLTLKTMTAENLGIGENFNHSAKSVFPLLETPKGTLRLQDTPVIARDGLFDDGLRCYLARTGGESECSYVVKFKWRNVFKGKEEDILNTIREKHIPGVVELLHDAKIIDTAQLRAGLRHQTYRRLLEDEQKLDTGRGLEHNSKKTDSPFRNRTCMCLIFSPVGQSLSTSTNKLELLNVLRDSVQTHRMLLQDANILHRDISDENILISATTRKALLIDFDVAMDLSKETPTGNSITGTQAFMAAGLMNEDPHTYRHDLESFFYVLLQVITCNKGELAGSSRFQRWRVDDWDTARDARIEDMAGGGLELLLEEWDEHYADCKELARRVWRLLFRDDKDIFLGTDMSTEGTDALYDGFIEAFNYTITSLEEGLDI